MEVSKGARAVQHDAVLGRRRPGGGQLARRRAEPRLADGLEGGLIGAGAAAELDEQPAKRACVAPEAAQQDGDCVFVKVTTLAERDAIGRAHAIVLD